MVVDSASMVYDLVVTKKEAAIYIDIIALKKWPNYQSYLYQWLSEYGFSAWDDIYNLVDAQSGKQVLAPDFRIIKDRNHLIINSIATKEDNQDYFLFENQTEINFPLKLKLSYSNSELVSENSSIFVDANQLVFPLTIRKWKKGDLFQPYGMGGKSKKISKFFKDQKMSLLEKEKTWLLCSDSKIVWVIGIRQDERYSVAETTQNKLQIVVLK
jgi:tRNA(Ile)-lysidine synthase